MFKLSILYRKYFVFRVKPINIKPLCFQSPKLNQEIQFKVGCHVKLTKLFYYIVGRGNVLISQVVNMDRKKIGFFEFNSTLTMAPSSSLVVYYITETGKIISDETEFTFEPEPLANQVNTFLNLLSCHYQ
jgi:Alpha-2-macroglobulin bait region domain